MTIFGWILVGLLSLATVGQKTDPGGRVLCLILVISTLVWGTGYGL